MSKETKKQPAAKKPQMTMDTPFILKLTVTLTSICLVVSLLLGIVNSVTEPIIDEKQAAKTTAAMAQVLAAEEYRETVTTVANVSAMYEALSGNDVIGYVMEVTANGFGGAIDMVVGVDLSGCVTGVSVISDSETANLGKKVTTNQDVLDRFTGLGGTITVNSGENRFDGVTGATVSSKAVTAGVNNALAAVASHKS